MGVLVFGGGGLPRGRPSALYQQLQFLQVQGLQLQPRLMQAQLQTVFVSGFFSMVILLLSLGADSLRTIDLCIPYHGTESSEKFWRI